MDVLVSLMEQPGRCEAFESPNGLTGLERSDKLVKSLISNVTIGQLFWLVLEWYYAKELLGNRVLFILKEPNRVTSNTYNTLFLKSIQKIVIVYSIEMHIFGNSRVLLSLSKSSSESSSFSKLRVKIFSPVLYNEANKAKFRFLR